jgi:hypothetical protein
MLPMVAACDDDDDVVQTPLPTPTGVTYTATYKSIDCSWDRVEGATNYGYELTDADGKVITRSVTQVPELSFTDLTYSTVYYLNVWAYGAYQSENGTSATATYEFRTADLTPIDTPVVTVKMTSSTKAQFSWTAITNADNYTYTLKKSDGTVLSNNTVTRTSVSFTLEAGATYYFTVVANTTAEGYCNSAEGSAEVTIESQDTPPAP